MFLFLGALTALGHSPFDLPVATLGGLLGVFWLFGSVTAAKEAAFAGWITATGYFAATVYWIVNPFLVDAARHGWMAPFALLFMATGLALFWALAFWAAYASGANTRRRAVALVLCLTLAELARSYVLTGFPWGLIGYVWIDTSVAQWAAWIGPHGLGLLTMTIVGIPAFGAWSRQGALLGVTALAAVWATGFASNLLWAPSLPEAQLRLRLVQPNAPQHEKWDPAYAAHFYRRQLALTSAAANEPLDLVIWSETAVPFWLGDQPDALRVISAAAGSETRVILGAVRGDGPKAYNSMALLGSDGSVEQVYDKSRLVPFGEYIPFGDFLAGFGIHGIAASEGQGFSSGPGSRLLDLGKAGKVLPLICYEAIFPQLVNSWTERPDWILQITNDAWFGHVAGPQQHLVQARMRAIEQGLPLVRVANTGISAVINAKGAIVSKLDLDTAGALDAPLPGVRPRTLYSYTGDLPVFLLAIFGLILIRGNRSTI